MVLYNLYILITFLKYYDSFAAFSFNYGALVKFAKDTVSCRELIEKSVETVSVTAELKEIELRTIIDGEPSFIGDIHYTSEAIVNLLKNAIEHTPSGGKITITAKGSNISTEITITDTGEGIPETELSHIFERFYRSSEYTKNGFGIGLAFAKRVISAQDGSLKVSNVKPNGAEFTILAYLMYHVLLSAGISELFLGMTNAKLELPFYVDWRMLLISAAVGIVWVFLSAYGVGMRIIKKSPMEAIITRSDKVEKVRKRTLSGLLFGISGSTLSEDTALRKILL